MTRTLSCLPYLTKTTECYQGPDARGLGNAGSEAWVIEGQGTSTMLGLRCDGEDAVRKLLLLMVLQSHPGPSARQFYHLATSPVMLSAEAQRVWCRENDLPLPVGHQQASMTDSWS